MPNRVNTLLLDHIHSEAVWQSIGERLRETMRDQPEMTPRLRAVIARLPELDREQTPSIVPDMDMAETY
ncbi:hypothetical protein BH10PSE10_BH10PSE10_26400 [soil metagenome]